MEGHKNQQIIKELKKNAIFSAEQKKTEDKKQQLMENHANRKIAATVKKKVPVRGLPPIPQKDIRILQPMENLQEDNLKKKELLYLSFTFSYVFIRALLTDFILSAVQLIVSFPTLISFSPMFFTVSLLVSHIPLILSANDPVTTLKESTNLFTFVCRFKL